MKRLVCVCVQLHMFITRYAMPMPCYPVHNGIFFDISKMYSSACSCNQMFLPDSFRVYDEEQRWLKTVWHESYLQCDDDDDDGGADNAGVYAAAAAYRGA